MPTFDEHAQAIAKRQYLQEGDGDILGMFRRVAREIAKVERPEDRAFWEERFFELMSSKRFSPGGRILAGAGTPHGNLLNCFVQGATENPPESFAGIMEVAKKLALVTKVGGGNGVNLDPYRSRGNRKRQAVRGVAYLAAGHPDVEDFIRGLMRPPTNPDGAKEEIALKNFVRVVYGELAPELKALAERHGVLTVKEPPKERILVPDDMGGIIEAAKEAADLARRGQEPHVDFSLLRPEGAPIRGSGGTSSGPVSFLFEIFDHFLEWAALGAEGAGPVATLRYVYAPVLRVVRQGGTRRGAGMATLAIEHPDLLDFLTAKDLDREKAEGDISTFNISVLVTDAFMKALEEDALWPVAPVEVPGKYYPHPVEGPYTGKVPELPERGDGAKPVPLYGGKVPARWLWHEIAWHAWATGEPGLIFVDRINGLSALKGLGERYQIRSTNPCFVGPTRIPTEYGLVPIAELAEKGSFFLVTDNRAPFGGMGQPLPQTGTAVRRAAKAFFTGTKPVVRLRTREGLELTLTPDHLVLTPEGYREAGALKPGDRVLVQSGEGLFPKEDLLPAPALAVARERVAAAGSRSGRGREDVKGQYARLPTRWSPELGAALGWLLGDGYLREDGVGFYFSRKDYEEVSWLPTLLQDWFGGGTLQETPSNTYHLHFNRIPAEFFQALGVKPAKATEKRVPESLFRAPREAVVGFLRGLFSADGSVQVNPSKQDATIRLASSSLGLLQDVQLLLLNLGIYGKIHRRRAAGEKLLPDGRGGHKAYPVAEQYELILGAQSRDRFAEVVGFLQPEKQAKLRAFLRERPRGSYRKPFVATVASVEAAGTAPVYDLTEPVTHSLVAGGLVCHNCGEIPLTVGEPCDLGALNLAAYVRDGEFQMAEFRQDVHTAIRFLDNVLDANQFALEDNEEAAKRLRRLGLGVMGLADALIRMGLPYSSEKAREKVYAIISALREEAIRASEALAEERGPFPLYEEHREYFQALGVRPRRNVAVLTVAPTGTTSMLMGVSSGIEPVFSPFVWRRIGGEYKPLLHPLFVELMEAYPSHPDYARDGGWDWEKIIAAIQEDGHGSVKRLPFVPEAIREVFECAHDISPLDHVRMQGAVQRAFDAEGLAGNSLSKCIAKGTLIPTSRGLIPVEDIAPPHPEDTFVPVEGLYTAEGYRITAHYYAGKKRAVRIRLDNGAELVGAWESHRVLTPDGWRLMRDLSPGDVVLGKLVPSHGPGGAPLPQDYPLLTNANNLPLPEHMSPDLALFLGMMAADGSTVESTGFVGIATKSEEVEAVFRDVVQKLFGVQPRCTLDRRTGVRNLYLTSRRLVRFVEDLIGKGARNKRTPHQILQGSPEEKLAFLRGLTLDGYARPDLGLVVYEGRSQRLAYEAAELARSFGLPTVHQGRKRVEGPKERYLVHSVVVSGPLQDLILPVEAHKRIPRVEKLYRVFVPEALVASSHVGTGHPGYANLKSIRQRRVQVAYNRTADRLGWPTETLAYRVVEVREAGEEEMYDIEVDAVHSYVVNGVISHNTINLPNHASVEDVEAAYAEAYRTRTWRPPTPRPTARGARGSPSTGMAPGSSRCSRSKRRRRRPSPPPSPGRTLVTGKARTLVTGKARTLRPRKPRPPKRPPPPNPDSRSMSVRGGFWASPTWSSSSPPTGASGASWSR
ncbi:LAGLIDADG family homing endonuclease [Thermus thermamylovorans]|uniref:LAGLIDADG family homing endonuclease n=1 Tax=Thermus thermamylovorans TaxID=2509362 RepID=UPI0026816483